MTLRLRPLPKLFKALVFAPSLLMIRLAIAQSSPSAPFSVQIDADSTRMKAASPEEIKEILQGAKTDIIALSPYFTPAIAETASSDWFQWGRFGDRVCPLSLKLDSSAPPDAVRACVSRSLDGTTLLVVNRSERVAKITFGMKASAGFYRLERLDFTPSKPVHEGDPPSLQTALLAQSGTELTQKGTLQRVFSLEPGQISLIRCTELSSLTRRAYQSAIALLSELRGGDASAANRLRAILREGEPYLFGLQAGGSAAFRAKRYKYFQRLALSYNQAQSRVRNYLQQNRVQQDIGKRISDALQRFENGLGEIGGLMAGLVAYLKAAPEKDDPAMPNMRSYSVVVTLAHGGARVAHGVALDLDRKNLPPDILCAPSEPETFATLAPAQMASATFHLRVPVGRAFSPRQCVGDVSFRFFDAPLHLFPQTW